MTEAVVIVSGGSAISPFTTPDAVCGSGQAAGSTDTFLRSELLRRGHEVFTAPAYAGEGPAESDAGFAGFTDPPEVLPVEVTINSVGSIDLAGSRLLRFLAYLRDHFGYDQFSLVAHSMGGLFATAALSHQEASLPVRRLVTVGTPWQGGFAADYAAGTLPLSAAGDDPRFEQVLTEFAAAVESLPPDNAGQQVTAKHVRTWLPAHAEALRSMPVTLIGGDAFSGTGEMFPNDGLVTLDSSLAQDVAALAQAPRHCYPDAHSIYFADRFGLPWQRALTWDPAVAQTVGNALD